MNLPGDIVVALVPRAPLDSVLSDYPALQFNNDSGMSSSLGGRGIELSGDR